MRALFLGVILLASVHAFADVLRSDKHLVKIEASAAAGATRQYNVQIFEAESRGSLAHLKLSTKNDQPAEAETTSGTMQYKVRVEPHGESYLFAFEAYDGAELLDAMRGGFVPGSRTKPAPSRAPMRAGQGTNEAKVVRRIEPLYTDDAKAAGAIGSVVLEVTIDKSGFVREATVIKPMGYGLSESAIDAVKQWQFEPTMHERMPIELLQQVTIEFKP
jgi:TonB family protein